jgi:hypothetical protein
MRDAEIDPLVPRRRALITPALFSRLPPFPTGEEGVVSLRATAGLLL